MSEEREPKRLSMGETHRRITHLCLDARGIKFGDFLHALIDKSIHLKEQEQKQADEQSDAHKTAEALARISAQTEATNARTETIEAQTAFLYHDRKGKIKKHQEQGKINQEKADTAEAKDAARDLETALKRVHDRVTRGETNVSAVCTSVILHFKPLTTKKKANGDYEDYEPLMTARGEPMQYETLAKYYRKKYGTKREHKANAAKNQARTQAARKSKAARSKRKK